MKSKLHLDSLPMPGSISPTTRLGKWLFQTNLSDTGNAEGQDRAPGEGQHHHHQEKWYKVLWLTGVDYFSTLGYQPGLALLAAGFLSPIATFVLVLVTLFCALPTYSEVAKRSFAGQGSIAILENLLGEWWSKLAVLILLGFAGTDFIITITLSAADAAIHVVENPLLHPLVGDHHILLTLGLVIFLAAVFLKGFKEAVGISMLIGIPFILFNWVVLAGGLIKIFETPDLWINWTQKIHFRGGWGQSLVLALFIFPKLALGMSGYETGVSVMPQIKGAPGDNNSLTPTGRIRNTRKLLLAAAVIMCSLLILSSFVTCLLIPEAEYMEGGKASGRAIAYLAHELFGTTVGTLYDISTILILAFAGASAMAGLLNIIPRYLPRFGMAPRWVAYQRPLILLITGICVLVTMIFKADVEAQGGAYATGVLALMLSGAVAVTLALVKEIPMAREKAAWKKFKCLYFAGVSIVFAFTFFDNAVLRPDGILITSTFIVSILVLGAISRWQKALDLRVADVEFLDENSQKLWKKMTGKKVHLVPLRTQTPGHRTDKAKELKTYYSFKGSIAFIHVHLQNNRSEFLSHLRIRVFEDRDNFVVEVYGAIAIANTIAYLSEQLNPISIFVGLTRGNRMTQALKYLLWGEGETGLLVYQILLRYWEWTPEHDERPLIFLMSD